MPNESTSSPPTRGYPRPQLRRPSWMSLNGNWNFCFDGAGAHFKTPKDISEWTHSIEVPFAPESKRSGIGDTGFHQACWYERTFCLETNDNDLRTILHFGAVDYFCRVWINGEFVGSHQGGHTPFSFDITSMLQEGPQQNVTVCALDNPHDLAKPRGKQDWQLEPHSIWYPRTTGIWQTVWLEQVSKTHIERLRWTPYLERWEIVCEAHIADGANKKLNLRVKLSVGDKVLAHDTYEVIHGDVTRAISLSDPGIDDYRNELLWSPEKPTLIQAHLQIWENNTLLDEVYSYTALRCVAIQKDMFMLNGRPYFLRLILDQGYWPDSLMTAPDDEAFKLDIDLVKSMGFNGVRKHQKIEDPRFLYWADRLGILVWEEMPSAYRFTHDSVERIISEWTEVIDRDYSHPCIITWVPFNESWGVPDLAAKAAHQNCVQALYHMTKTLDPTRPVLGNDGWESTASDIIGIHDYDNDPHRILQRYNTEIDIEKLLGMRRPAGRLLTVEGHPHRGQPLMLTEFGGIAYVENAVLGKQWGYAISRSREELQSRYAALLHAINSIDCFAGFCYTQFTDMFQEANGLLHADRTPKFPMEHIYKATRGLGFEREERIAKATQVDESA